MNILLKQITNCPEIVSWF